jgi:hypothetical protein
MPTKAEQFRYTEQRDPKNKKKDEGHHVKRTSRMSKRKAADGTPLHDNVRAGKKATVRKEAGSRKSTRRSKKGRRESNLELRSERAQRAPTTRARQAKTRAVRPRGSNARAAGKKK